MLINYIFEKVKKALWYKFAIEIEEPIRVQTHLCKCVYDIYNYAKISQGWQK